MEAVAASIELPVVVEDLIKFAEYDAIEEDTVER
jgi:hypothetical protein